MSNLKIIEKEIERKINKFKNSYFNLSFDDVVDDFIENATADLEKIRNFIKVRLFIKDMPQLMANVYIYNRNKIREENDQFRKEVAAKVQCLKDKNTVFVDPNHEVDVLGFNKIPWIHFKHVGLAIGEYKITIPEHLPFGILYDFEEYPNKKFSYDVEEKNLEVMGTPTGDSVEIIEDKFIDAPGDIDDDDKFDSLLNIGPYTFNVQFYTGEITLRVTGNFGTVSYYIKDKGYMGGQKRLKFSELCLLNE
tara:strand:+ start:180 stop:929 length:750 start_codon:yes stop_codon:yes gene_type:complete